MIVNKQSLIALAPIKNMFTEKKIHIPTGTTYGLAENGYDIRLKQTLKIPPHSFMLGSSIEEFHMPATLVGMVHDKSTNVRQKLSVFNTVIDSGWCGFLTLELYNHSDHEMLLHEGMGIAQVLFHEVVHPAMYQGAYQNQPDRPVTGKEDM